MVIVEGPDGSGKTRLILRLMESFNLPVEPRAVDSDQQMLVDIPTWVDGHMNGWPRRALYDRFALISGPIYAPVMSTMHEQSYLQDDLWMTDRLEKFRLLKPCIIFCLPPIEEVRYNCSYGQEKQPEKVVDRLDTLYWLYRMEEDRHPFALRWDYTKHNYDRLLVDINLQLREANVQY